MRDRRYEVPVAGVSPEQLAERLKQSIAAVQALWPAGTGITLFVFEFGDRQGLSYISNAERPSMIATIEEWLERQRKLS